MGFRLRVREENRQYTNGDFYYNVLHVKLANKIIMKARVFIGSSVERLNIAYALQSNLEYCAEVTVWDQGIFNLSSNALSDLIQALNRFDFAIFVFHPDDWLHIKDKDMESIRDNVIFELGLFMGKLGQENVFLLIPRNYKNLRIPTDLIGIKPGTYDSKREDENLVAALGPFCNELKKRFSEFQRIDLEPYKDQSDEVIKIISKMEDGYEHELMITLLSEQIKKLEERFKNYKKGLLRKKNKLIIDPKEYVQVIMGFVFDFKNILEFDFQMLLIENEQVVTTPLGAIELVNNLFQGINRVIDWQIELDSYISIPVKMETIEKLKTSSAKLINFYLRLPEIIEEFLCHIKKGNNVEDFEFEKFADNQKGKWFDLLEIMNVLKLDIEKWTNNGKKVKKV